LHEEDLSMTQVTIPFPEDLKERAEQTAAKAGTSLEEFVRESVELRLGSPELSWSTDPFLSDREVWEGPGPSDMSESHDDYLYGDKD
jgi:hypothetical protein